MRRVCCCSVRPQKRQPAQLCMEPTDEPLQAMNCCFACNPSCIRVFGLPGMRAGPLYPSYIGEPVTLACIQDSGSLLFVCPGDTATDSGADDLSFSLFHPFRGRM
jgi:hypothetical protein